MGDRRSPSTPAEMTSEAPPLTPEATADGQDPTKVSEPTPDELFAGVVDAPNDADVGAPATPEGS